MQSALHLWPKVGIRLRDRLTSSLFGCKLTIQSFPTGYSVYLDSLCNNATQNFSRSILEFDLGGNFSDYFDFVSFGITMLLTVMLCFGVKESTSFNSVFIVFNCSIVLFVIVIGSLNADFSNWTISPEEAANHTGAGTGGFLPHGIPGLLAASASCFYFFVGFDVVATCGEEAKNPRKTIPKSIILCLLIVFLGWYQMRKLQQNYSKSFVFF